MIWTTPSAALLEGVMTTYEATLAQTAVSVGTPDRIPGIIANQVAEIRGMIATWSPNTLSADTSKIPPSMMGRALVLIRNTVLTSVPEYVQSDERKAETKDANDYFLLVAKGIIRPEPAIDAIPTTVPTQNPSHVTIVSAPGSRTGRYRMNGI